MTLIFLSLLFIGFEFGPYLQWSRGGDLAGMWCLTSFLVVIIGPYCAMNQA